MHSAVCTSRVKTTIHAMSSPFMQHHSQISIVTINSDFSGTFQDDIEKIPNFWIYPEFRDQWELWIVDLTYQQFFLSEINIKNKIFIMSMGTKPLTI